jgi:hypothetical protein
MDGAGATVVGWRGEAFFGMVDFSGGRGGKGGRFETSAVRQAISE